MVLLKRDLVFLNGRSELRGTILNYYSGEACGKVVSIFICKGVHLFACSCNTMTPGFPEAH